MGITQVSSLATVRMSRIERAAQLRDAALSLLRAYGILRRHTRRPAVTTYAGVADLQLLLRTPLSRLPQPDEQLKYMAALLGRDHINLPYGLDVWAGRKVLNLEWDHDDRIEIVSFRRGPWEDILL
jgi:hypothetical protein